MASLDARILAMVQSFQAKLHEQRAEIVRKDEEILRLNGIIEQMKKERNIADEHVAKKQCCDELSSHLLIPSVVLQRTLNHSCYDRKLRALFQAYPRSVRVQVLTHL
jgi:hypothetical protein